MGEPGKSKAPKSEKSRGERLAAELRANLSKRKARKRALRRPVKVPGDREQAD